jgi:hypothetical protein
MDTNFHNYKREYDVLWVFDQNILKENILKENILKEKSHNGLKILFLKSRYQFISKYLKFSSRYVGYMFSR